MLSSIRSPKVTTYYILVKKVIALAVQAIALVLFFTRALTFDYAVVSRFFSERTLSMKKRAATSKTNDSETRIAFVKLTSDWFFKKIMIN